MRSLFVCLFQRREFVAYFSALMLGYWAQRNWSFKARHAHTKALPRYLLPQGSCAQLSGLRAEFANRQSGIPAVSTAVVSPIVMGAISFVVSLT